MTIYYLAVMLTAFCLMRSLAAALTQDAAPALVPIKIEETGAGKIVKK